MNIRPWFTIGVVSWASTRSVLNDQARESFPMLLVVICLKGLKPEPSYVRRYISQSPASGCCSRSSVTVGYGVDPTCTPCAATCAAGRHSHNVRYDAGRNLISYLPFSIDQRRSEKAGKAIRPSSKGREPERRRLSVRGDFDLQSHRSRRKASAAPRLSACEIAGWSCGSCQSVGNCQPVGA